MQQYYECPRCHAPIALGVRFCGNCGTQLTWSIVQETNEKQRQEPTGIQMHQAGYGHQIQTKTKRNSRRFIGPIVAIVCVVLLGVIIFATGIPFHNNPPVTLSPTPSPDGGDYAAANVENASDTLKITLADGTAIIATPGSLAAGTIVSARKIDPDQAPSLPDGFDGAESLYDFKVDGPIHGTITLHIAMPEVNADSIIVLSHYHNGQWEAVPFTADEQFVVVETSSLSIWGWLDMNIDRFADWADSNIMKYADTSRYIDWYERTTGISSNTQPSLENTSSNIYYNDTDSKGMLSASAVSIGGNDIRLRVRNNTKFYLEVNFEGADAVQPVRGGYINDFPLQFSEIMKGFLPSKALLLLPEGTAEFTVHQIGESLKIRGQFTDLAAFYSEFDPALGLTKIVDMEVFTAVRDVLGESNRLVRSTSALEDSFTENVYELLDLVDLASRTGVLLGEKAINALANMLVIPSAVQIRKTYFEGRGIDIANKAAIARYGVSLTFGFAAAKTPVSEPEPPGTDVVSSSGRGNSVGNIVNRGLATEQEGWIYYRSNDGGKIYKMRTDGSERTKLNDESSSYINVLDGWVYYAKGQYYGSIYRMRTDGSERTQLNNENSSYINVVDGYIYYAVGDSGGIYRMRTDGSGRTQLTKEFSEYINVVDDWIYYQGSNDEIYKMRTDGSGRTQIGDHGARYINVVDGWIYYARIVPYSYLYKIRIDGSENTQLNNEHSEAINVMGGWVYYYTYTSKKFSKISIDGGGYTQLYDKSAYAIDIIDDWIYFQGSEGIYRMRTDGSERQLVD